MLIESDQKKKWNWPKNMLLLKNPQFSCNHYETWSKCGIYELLILTKFRNDCIKIVDFSIKAYFYGQFHFLLNTL